MATLNTRTILVCAALALAGVLLAQTAGAQEASFIAARSFATDSNPIAIAVADFNGDGRQDLAVANYLSNTVSVLLGNGDGTFQPAQSFATDSSPRSVAVG